VNKFVTDKISRSEVCTTSFSCKLTYTMYTIDVTEMRSQNLQKKGSLNIQASYSNYTNEVT